MKQASVNGQEKYLEFFDYLDLVAETTQIEVKGAPLKIVEQLKNRCNFFEQLVN